MRKPQIGSNRYAHWQPEASGKAPAREAPVRSIQISAKRSSVRPLNGEASPAISIPVEHAEVPRQRCHRIEYPFHRHADEGSELWSLGVLARTSACMASTP